MKTALVLIDIQEGLIDGNFYEGNRNNPDAEKNCGKILQFFRRQKMPVFHVQHNSTNPDSPLFPGKTTHKIQSEVVPIEREPLFQKSVNSAFIGTDLEKALRKDEINRVIIVGLTTEHCVSTTTRMAANLGFEVILVSDATAAFGKIGIDGKRYDAETIHQTQLAVLKDEFAEIVPTAKLLEMLALS